eukprot:COSAG04_NODE_672_length_11281_cov_16.794402_9_plen_330_part_00
MPRAIEQPLLAADADVEGGSFALTLQDLFSATVTVPVRADMTVLQLKESLQEKKGESVEYLDSLLLLFKGQPLHDDATLGSSGLSSSTIVSLSQQDAAKGRAQRRERGERALAAQRAAEASAAAEQADRRRTAELRQDLDARACRCARSMVTSTLMMVGGITMQIGWWTLYSDICTDLAVGGGAAVLLGACVFDCCFRHSDLYMDDDERPLTPEERQRENARRAARGETELKRNYKKGEDRHGFHGLVFIFLPISAGLGTWACASWCPPATREFPGYESGAPSWGERWSACGLWTVLCALASALFLCVGVGIARDDNHRLALEGGQGSE